jgi:asparagine synthase (glutamine-hydrolysing)
VTALAGYWSFNGRANIAACRQMLDAQREFGPEAPVIQEVGPIALGARQFSMLPEDREGGSTINLSGGSLLLAGDVRLDNRAQLISELGYASSEANSLSDTGLLARAFHRWEEGALQRIVGDFAFAVWDGRRSRLLLARDFSGQRPLHYHRQSGFIAFASMPGGLHALREIPRAPDLRAMAQFLALVPEGDTGSYFEEIAKVPPGHLVTFTPDGTAVHRFWQPTLTPIRFPNDRDYEEAIQEKFDRAVGQRLRGQPQVASHLSAGLDSASVTATAARLLRASGGRVTAFTAVPRPNYQGQAPAGRFADEGPLASETAALHPNIDHVLMPSPLRLPTEDLHRHFRLTNVPF